MEIDREALTRRYSDLNDAELLRRLQRGDLTELAEEVALAELAARGLSMPQAAAESPVSTLGLAAGAAAADDDAAQPLPVHPVAEVEFGADQFADNPYQTPRASVEMQDTARRRQPAAWTAWFWGIYMGYVGLLIGIGTLRWFSDALNLPGLIGLLLNAWGLVGLIGWRLQRRFVHAGLWVVCLAVVAAQYLFSVLSFVRLVLPAGGAVLSSTLFPVAVLFLLSGLPLLWGLLRYAFFSQSIWLKKQTVEDVK